MNWVRASAAVLVLWSSTAWAATLTWTANSEPDLAGYRVYQCSQQPCTRTSAAASLLVTLGTVTSFNIGTPAVTQYYIITAYDFANNESAESNLATFTPTGSPPPVVPPPVIPPPVIPPPVVPPPVIPPPVIPPPVVPPPATPPPVVPPAIGASPTSLSFTATQGGANPATQTVSISNQGGGTLSWTASDNAPWLTRNPASGTGNGAVTLSVTTGTLTAGGYSATVIINATGASPLTVPVTFTVTTAPVPPAIGASPTSLSFAATQGGAIPAPQTLRISNQGGGILSWTAGDNATWLTLSPTSGTGNGAVTVTVTTGTLTAGSYSSTVTMNAVGASSVIVPVTFTVTTTPVPPPPPPPPLAAPSTPAGLHITIAQ